MVRPCYKEIYRLKEMLDINNIPYTMEEGYFNGAVITYPDNVDTVCSVIEHDGSYGKHDDKIELMGLLTEKEETYDKVVGWLTAEEVFKRIKEHYNKKAT